MILYIFDRDKRVRKIVPMEAVSELVHDEADKTITATIADDSAVKTGEHIGFKCVDDHFRLFTVTRAEKHDDTHTIYMRGTDAIIRELQEIIVEEKQQLDVGLKEAIQGLLDAAGVGGLWTITGDAPERTEKSRAYYTSVYEMLEAYRALYEWQYDAWYEYDGGEIAGRIIHLSPDEAVFRGRVLTSKRDATSVYVTSTTEPVTRLYGIGPSTGSGDEQTNLTFEDAVWSKEKGDPADKPKGQTWVEDAEAIATYGLHAAVEQIQEMKIDGEDAPEDKKPEVLLQKTWERLQERKHPSCTVEAVIQDMEQVPGYEHQIIRMGDLLPIRLTDATMEEARVIRIKRDYVRPWLTKLTIGDKTETIQTQVSSLIVGASHTFERLTIYKNRFHEDEALIQLNAKHIQRNADTIVDNAQQILLRAEKKDLEAAQIMIDGINEKVTAQAKEIEMRAKKGDLDAAVLRLDAAEGSITAQAKKIDAQAEEIALKASNLRVDAIETTITGLVRLDELQAKFVEVVGGSVVAEMLSGYDVDANSLVAGSVNTDYLSADSITTDVLTVSGASLKQSTLTIGEKSCTFFAPADANFELSDMPGYDDALAAARTEGASSVQVMECEYDSQSYTAPNKYLEAHCKISLSNDRSGIYRFIVPASDVYGAGAESVTCTSVTLSSETAGSLYVTVNLSNGKSVTKSVDGW